MGDKFVVFTTKDCPYCKIAINELDRDGNEVYTIDVSEEANRVFKMLIKDYMGLKTVPQIFKLMGGSEYKLEE